MELEELKKLWGSVDTCLQEQELLKKVILKESLVNKSDKGLSRMINYDYFGVTIVVFGLFVVIWGIFQYPQCPLPLRINLYLTAVFLVYVLIQGIIGLLKLSKIDFSSSIKENLQRISAYRIWYHKQLIITLLSIVVLVVSIIIYFFSIKAQTSQWIFLFGCLGGGAVGTWWEYKRMYQKNMDIIQKSLEGLKELEEE